jgi:ribosome-binding factor A|tara:strand:+ start:279 stop:683 length:405 start_codon:yes stop_codon:yes gene_type:complete
MTSRRVLKAAQAIREVVSLAILTELRDPRVDNVTVTTVEVTGDMKQARIHVTVMGEDTNSSQVLKGLSSAAGFLQRKIANRIESRYTPKLEFVLDQGQENAREVARILEDLASESKTVTQQNEDPTDTATSSET